MPLRGRERERVVLDQLVSDARSGRSGVLMIRGEPGIGKTALLEDLCERSEGVTVVRGTGVESESELPFAALHHMCSQMMEGALERLPEPQRNALRVAFGQSAGEPPDPFLVGLAVLNRLADVAEQQPLVVVVDDAQWLDRASAQTMAFVARRLQAESVAVAFAVRNQVDQLKDIPELVISGLAPDDARELLTSALSAPVDDRVRERLVAEAHGNPLALLELPRSLGATELVGGFGSDDARGVASRLEASFARRIEALPLETRMLLLIAAAEPLGDPVLLWQASELLGVSSDAATAAESDGLLDIGVRVVFRHPLVRSVAYRLAPLEDRRRAHDGLARATDAGSDPDRRAWHRAWATSAPDEAVAAELERSAVRAQARGGFAAAGAFLKRAVELTRDPGRRRQRALAAAEASLAAGAPDEAVELLSLAGSAQLDEGDLARCDLVRAQIALAVNRASDAPGLLLKAAQRLEPLDVGVARETYLEAFIAAMWAGRCARSGGLRETAEAARSARPRNPARASDLLLDGLALMVAEGYAAGAPALKRAVSAFCDEQGLGPERLAWHWLPLASHAAMILWDPMSRHILATRLLSAARDAGALGLLPIAINDTIASDIYRGRLASAASMVAEIEAVADATGRQLAPYGALMLAAWVGREQPALELFEATARGAIRRGEGMALSFIEWSTALLHNGNGRYEAAAAAAQPPSERPEELCSPFVLPELIEAAARSGCDERAAEALDELVEMTAASGTDWARAVEARARALLASGAAAEVHYRDATERFGRVKARAELARTQLLYGEWLRREGRRVDAREQLRSSHAMLESMGAEGFAARAARELAATGERVRRRTVMSSDELTAQEAQIARLAAGGYSNREIGQQLFISHRTVGYHLGKVFAKLGVSNRAQLHAALGGTGSEPPWAADPTA